MSILFVCRLVSGSHGTLSSTSQIHADRVIFSSTKVIFSATQNVENALRCFCDRPCDFQRFDVMTYHTPTCLKHTCAPFFHVIKKISPFYLYDALRWHEKKTCTGQKMTSFKKIHLFFFSDAVESDHRTELGLFPLS